MFGWLVRDQQCWVGLQNFEPVAGLGVDFLAWGVYGGVYYICLLVIERTCSNGYGITRSAVTGYRGMPHSQVPECSEQTVCTVYTGGRVHLDSF